jgi:3-hydroxyisobutyrate dehydrogenase-like beta-hydroxyacid dehydrogenase
VSEASSAVGVVGLGEMGLPIARNLLRAGYRVHGCDADPLARNRAGSAGISAVDDLDVAAKRAATWLVVVPAAAVPAVVKQLAETLAADSLVIVCSSVNPGVMSDVAAVLDPAGVRVCDAALARGVPAAHEGSLLLYCGGDAETIERATPLLRAFARDVTHVGPLGSGQTAKLLNNLLLWSTVAAVTDTLRLAAAMGLDTDAVVQALALGSARSWVLDTWSRPRPMPDLEHDLERALATAELFGVELPIARVVQQVMTDVKQRKAAAFAGTGAARSMADFVRATSPHQAQQPENS